MEDKIKLSDLTPAQRKALLRQLEKEQAKENALLKETRKTYKEKVDKVVPDLFKALQKLSNQISEAKTKVYGSLEGLITEKSEAYQRKDEPQSHSFTSLDGKQTITIGYRVNDGWDDTVDVGIGKVAEFIKAMGKDKNSKALVETILQLLSKDSKGNLKASRVLQLQKLSEEINNPLFTDAINIIKEAYKPVQSKQFVSVRFKNDRGESVDLPLSITDAPLITADQV